MQLVQAPKFIITVAQFYNADTRKYVDGQGRTIFDLSADMLGFVFGIPSRDEVLLTTEEDVVEVWRNDTASCKRHMNENWLEEERKTRLKPTNILRADFKEPQRDLIIMLRKAFGKTNCRHFNPWMFQCMITILIGKQYFDRAQILSDNIYRQLIEVHKTKKFFFTSYVI